MPRPLSIMCPLGALLLIACGARSPVPSSPAHVAPREAARGDVEPSRVCVSEEGVVTVEGECGCGETLVCDVAEAGPGELVVTTRLAPPERDTACDACFAMAPGRCRVPTGPSGVTRIRAGSLTVTTNLTSGRPPAPRCAAHTRR